MPSSRRPGQPSGLAPNLRFSEIAQTPGGSVPAGVRIGAVSPAIVSINASSWGTLQGQNPQMKDDVLVVLAQETKLLAAQIPDATHWLAVRGWKAVWLPAQQTEQGGTSSGVAILVRDRLGIRLPTEQEGGHEVVPHRVIAAMVQLPAALAFVLYSAYLVVADGLGQCNVAHLEAIGAHALHQKDPIHHRRCLQHAAE